MSKKPSIFGTLISQVINKDLCMFCGTCIASCPIDVLLTTKEEKPTIRGPCALCQVCYYSCPRVELPIDSIERNLFGRTRKPEEALGIYRAGYSVRSKEDDVLGVCQDGGAITSLLGHALTIGLVDLAVVMGRSGEDPWKPKPVIATDRRGLLLGAGAKYMPGSTVSAIGEASVNYPKGRIAVVALPCETQGIRRLQTSWLGSPKKAERVVLVMGLFCSNIFYYDRLVKEYIEGRHGVDPNRVTKIGVKKGRFSALAGREPLIDVPVEEILPFARVACKFCVDYAAELADISVGAVGSPMGWSHVLIRTDIGEKLFNSARDAGIIDYQPLAEVKPGLSLVVKMAEKKKQRDASAYLRHDGESMSQQSAGG